MHDTLPLLATALALAAPLATAQQSQTASEAREAVGKVAALMEGQWRGHGTVKLGAEGRYALKCALTAASKADGTVLSMDAPYSLAPPDRPDEATPHNEVAVLSYNPTAREYRFDVFYADGRHETGSGTLAGRILRIVNVVPNAGFRRITIDLSSPGRYHETGERSRDGTTWEAYSDVVLTRVQH